MAIRILIVEAHDDFRITAKRFLESQDFKPVIFETKTREDGMRILQRRKPHIVLMDIQVADGDLAHIAKEIRLACPECHIVMLTMMQVNRIKHLQEYRGLMDFISKDEIYEKLLPCIRKIISRSVLAAAQPSK